MRDILGSNYITHARASGLGERLVSRRALRNTMPPVITLIGVQYGYLLGGAVLTESIFGWGGVGQYATESILFTDYSAIQGFVLLASTFSLLVYLVVDVLYSIFDPRIEY